MRFSDIKNAIKHMLKTSKCLKCEKKYTNHSINIIATTQNEGLFEAVCDHCGSSTIITMLMTPETNREHKSISKNDVLDIKNFMSRFDGDFKKLFIK